MSKRRNYEILGTVELSDEEANLANSFIEEAEKELEEARINFRWGKEQLNLVKRTANEMGVPYQTYIKQVVYRQCLQDLKDKKLIGI
ncbi:MAG: hypothetical protein U0457_10630 [Candidatus Sericytochromatia bacterium]